VTPFVNTPTDVLRGIAYTCLATATFAIMTALAKEVLQRFHVIQVMSFRTGFGLVPVLVALAWSGRLASLRTRRLPAHLFRGLCGMIAMAGSFISYVHLPLAEATALGFTAPLFMTALAWPLLGERIDLVRGLAVGVGFLGVLVMVRPDNIGVEVGALAALIGSLSYAFAVITMRQLTRTDPPTSVAFYNQLLICLLLCLPLPWFWRSIADPVDLAMLILIGLSGGMAQIWMAQGIQLAPVAVGAPYNYTQLLWASILGFAFFAEVPTLATLIGAAIVAGAGLALVWRESRRERPSAHP
jgi:drug/metabolite transporter (DMT)-like permease